MIYPYYKCELHCHLDGSLDASDAWEIAQHYQIDTGYDSYSEFEQHTHVDPSCRSLYDYLDCFDVPLRILQYEKALQECAYRLGKRFVQDHVLYGEIRFAPMQHTRKGMSQEQALRSVLSGIKQVMEEDHITLQLLLCMMVLPFDTAKENAETYHLCERYLHHGVCGLDLAGAEGVRPMEDFQEAFAYAKEHEIPFTIHAGENGYPDHVKTVLAYGAKRIGHGVHAIEDPAILEQLRQQDIPLEVCYTSNLQCLAFANKRVHPIRELFDAHVPITINTDNRSISRTTLEQEYDYLMKEFAFTTMELQQCNETALRHAFLDDEIKTKLLEEMRTKIVSQS